MHANLKIGFASAKLADTILRAMEDESVPEAEQSAPASIQLHGAVTAVSGKIAQGDTLSLSGRHGPPAQQFCGLHLLWAREQVSKCGHMDEPAIEHLSASQHSDIGGLAGEKQQGKGSCLARAGFP